MFSDAFWSEFLTDGLLVISGPVILFFARGVISYIRSRSFTLGLLGGVWYSYNSSTINPGQISIVEEDWRIKLSWRFVPIVLSTSKTRKGVSYRGRVFEKLDARHMIVEFSRRSDGERFQMRFVRPPQFGDPNIMRGLWLGRTYDDQPITGVVVVSRQPLDRQAVIAEWSHAQLAPELFHTTMPNSSAPRQVLATDTAQSDTI